MKKKDKLSNYLIADKHIFKFFIIISIIGIICGSLLITILNNTDIELVKNQIQLFIENISNNSFNYYHSLTNCLIVNLIVIISIWILGISVIGLPVIIVIVFIKSLMLGFTISSFITTYKLYGLIISFIYVFPASIINLIIYLIIATFAIQLCINIFQIVFKSKKPNFKSIKKKYTASLILSIFFITITALIETFITPNLLKLFVTLLLK